MCKIFAKDICNRLDRPYTIEQKNHFEGLLKQYVWSYINKVGGYHKLELFTESYQGKLCFNNKLPA